MDSPPSPPKLAMVSSGRLLMMSTEDGGEVDFIMAMWGGC